jgi:hypothetical protein
MLGSAESILYTSSHFILTPVFWRFYYPYSTKEETQTLRSEKNFHLEKSRREKSKAGEIHICLAPNSCSSPLN